jgi:hypothetical protein
VSAGNAHAVPQSTMAQKNRRKDGRIPSRKLRVCWGVEEHVINNLHKILDIQRHFLHHPPLTDQASAVPSEAKAPTEIMSDELGWLRFLTVAKETAGMAVLFGAMALPSACIGLSAVTDIGAAWAGDSLHFPPIALLLANLTQVSRMALFCDYILSSLNSSCYCIVTAV